MRFNRYMVECESNTAMLFEFVNFVLIDTWWNVNLYQINDTHASIRFNRYMVECEFIPRNGKLECVLGFNRYMVECEFQS